MISIMTMMVFAALPDAADVLRSADVRPNISLLLDASGSMLQGTASTNCNWFAANYNGGDPRLNKNEVMRSVLVGCQTANDGILDKWFSRVNFSIYRFGHQNDRAALSAAFGSSKATLESAALAIPAAGNTPMSLALRENALYLQSHFNDSNTRTCRPNYILLLSDGDPNGYGVTFNFNCPLPGDPLASLNVPALEPWLGAGYLTARHGSADSNRRRDVGGDETGQRPGRPGHHLSQRPSRAGDRDRSRSR